MFNTNELKQIFTLLQRVEIKGSEAVQIALLQQKISGLLKVQMPSKEIKETKEETKKDK